MENDVATLLLTYALARMREGVPLDEALINPGDDQVWLAAVGRFVHALPSDTGGVALDCVPTEVIIESLERAVRGERGR